MNRKILSLLTLALLMAAVAFPDTIPEQLRNEAKEYPAAIEQAVQSLNRQQLFDDAYFVKTLKAELKNKKHSEEEKTYYFYLMLRQIGWGFAGVLKMPCNGQYADTFGFQSQTLAAYRTQLQKLKTDSVPFYKLSKENAETKPLLASHALLLATMLEPDDETAFYTLMDIAASLLVEKQTAYPLRSMLLHTICYSLAMLEHEEKLPALAALREYALLEEEKEDVVIAGAMSGHEYAPQWVFQELGAITDSTDNLFARTCIYLLKKMMSDDSFKKLVAFYKENAETEYQKSLADTIIEQDYKTHYLEPDWEELPGLFTKIWAGDDLQLSVYDDGMLIKSGTFAEFIPK